MDQKIKTSVIDKKLELSLSIEQQTIDRQIQVHWSTKNSVSILVAIIAILISAVPKENCLWVILFFQSISVIVIIYAIWSILTIRLEIGPNMDKYLEKKKHLSYRDFLYGVHELLSDAIQKNSIVLENLRKAYILFRILTIILILSFILLISLDMSDKNRVLTQEELEEYGQSMQFNDFKPTEHK